MKQPKLQPKTPILPPLADPQGLTPKDIQDYCKEKIAHYKIPHYVLFVDSFPMTITGKVQKYQMREQSLALLKQQGLTPSLA